MRSLRMHDESGPSGRAASLLMALKPSVQERLYEFYDEIRAVSGCGWDRFLNAWVVTGHDLVRQVASDGRFSSARYPDLDAVPADLLPLARVLGSWMLYCDTPRHERLRIPVSRVLTPRAVELLRGQIEQTVDRLLGLALPRGEMDVVTDLAYPLPVSVICDLLRVPAADRSLLRDWSVPIAAVVGNARSSPATDRAGAEAMAELLEYFRRLLDRARPAPGGGLLEGLLDAECRDGAITPEEVLANCSLLVIAGHETTTHLIGNALRALLLHPEQTARLVADPALMPAAVEELLRYDCPVQIVLRRATEDLDLAGCRIAGGQAVVLVLGAANRDPAVFPEPHRLDLDRPRMGQLGFGHGAHFCLGAGLARMEVEIALRGLLTRLPGLRLADEPARWNATLNLRGLTSLKVTFDR